MNSILNVDRATPLFEAVPTTYRLSKSGKLTHQQRMHLTEQGPDLGETAARDRESRAAKFMGSHRRVKDDRAVAYTALNKEDKAAKGEDIEQRSGQRESQES